MCILEFSSSSNNSSLHRGVVKREAEAVFLTAADGDASVGTVLADDQEKTRTPLRTGGSGTEGTDTHNREQAHSIQTELDPGARVDVRRAASTAPARRVAYRQDMHRSSPSRIPTVTLLYTQDMWTSTIRSDRDMPGTTMISAP